MKPLLRPVLIITLFTLGGQAIGFVTQAVIASLFGARADMDAFLAANTLPQYIIAVLLSALGFVFIPVFVEYTTTGREDEAWEVASGVITICSLVLGLLALGGIFFAEPLLRLTTPGLSPESLHLAVRVAQITWPTIVATGLVSLLTSIYQVRGRFSWQAAVPVIGASVYLGLVVVLTRPLGVVGVAIAAAVNLVLQVVLLSPIILKSSRYHILFNWGHPGVRQVFHLLWPLVLSGLFLRWTPIIDRYLASNLAEGAISHLGYASKFLSLLIVLISTGITTVIFPRMALNTAGNDLAGLRHTVSLGLRVMWLAIAPTIAIGLALALPLVTAVLQRGAFSAADSQAVSILLQIYLFALTGACLGNIGGRTFYALKYTRLVAVLGVVEAIAYAIFVPLLARWLGIVGVALGYTLYFNLSFCFEMLILRYKMGNTGGATVLASFIRTALAAGLGGLVAWVITRWLPNVWLQLIVGGLLGGIVFVAMLWGLGSPDFRMVESMAAGWIKTHWPSRKPYTL